MKDTCSNGNGLVTLPGEDSFSLSNISIYREQSQIADGQLVTVSHAYIPTNIEKMSPENANCLPESDTMGLNFKETELTLGLPGKSRETGGMSGTKRGFSETVDLKLGSLSNMEHGKEENNHDYSENDLSGATKPSAAK